MVVPTQEAIDTFISITGAPDSVARQRLEGHGGNLNEAVNSYFNEADRNIVREASSEALENNYMDVDEVDIHRTQDHEFPQFPNSRNLNPFSLLNPNFRGSFLGRHLDLENFFPTISHPREVRDVPIEVKDDRPHGSGQSVLIEDVTGNVDDNGSEIVGNVTFQDDEGSPTGGGFRRSSSNVNNSVEEETYIEAEMIQAAIEASKQEAEEQEKALKGHEKKYAPSGSKLSNPIKIEILDNSPTSSEKPDVQCTSDDDFEVVDERPLIRRKSRNEASASVVSVKGHKNIEVKSPSRSPKHGDISDHSCSNGNSFHLDEWGGISSEEHDEAVMLEAAIFGVSPVGSGYNNFPYTAHQFPHTRLDGPASSYNWNASRPPSPSLKAQRIIREQQDDEYLASLQADQEKETKAKKDAEAYQLMELAAREATLKEEKMKEQETHRKAEEEKEMERYLAMKQASLPREPASDEDNAVTLLVRMPDGTKRGRRFLKSDRLQNLFDFVDVGRGVKSGSYRLVRPYPRRAMGGEEGMLTLEEVGLNGRQEALFLELI